MLGYLSFGAMFKRRFSPIRDDFVGSSGSISQFAHLGVVIWRVCGNWDITKKRNLSRKPRKGRKEEKKVRSRVGRGGVDARLYRTVIFLIGA